MVPDRDMDKTRARIWAVWPSHTIIVHGLSDRPAPNGGLATSRQRAGASKRSSTIRASRSTARRPPGEAAPGSPALFATCGGIG